MSRVNTDTATQISKTATQMFLYMGMFRLDSINTIYNEGQGKISSELLILFSILNSTKDGETGIATIGLKCEGEQQLIFCI